jgi:hypothetical protein
LRLGFSSYRPLPENTLAQEEIYLAHPVVTDSTYREREKAVMHFRVEPEVRRQFCELAVTREPTLTAAFERALRLYIAEENSSQNLA